MKTPELCASPERPRPRVRQSRTASLTEPGPLVMAVPVHYAAGKVGVALAARALAARMPLVPTLERFRLRRLAAERLVRLL